MHLEWLPRLVVPLGIALTLGLFRKFAPAPSAPASITSYTEHQTLDPLPTGVIGATMWASALCIVLSFFLLRDANRLWASLDGPADLRVYETSAIWCFLPGFGALTVPWPATIWILRKLGRTDEADQIVTAANAKGAMDCMRVMKWLNIGLIAPIAVITLLAIPMHLSILGAEARVGHFASMQPEIFRLHEAVRATLTEGSRDRYGVFHPGRNLYIDFSGGRRLNANSAGDGGSNVDDKVVQLLLVGTGLTAEHVQSVQDLPPLNTNQRK